MGSIVGIAGETVNINGGFLNATLGGSISLITSGTVNVTADDPITISTTGTTDTINITSPSELGLSGQVVTITAGDGGLNITTDGALTLTGGSIVDDVPEGSSGNYLLLTVNGTNYKLDLLKA
jgi:hypothetical protein